jgi:hypothetical protein
MDEVLDRFLAETLANRSLCMRMWGYLASASDDRQRFIERQRRLSLESVDEWDIQEHSNPASIRSMAKAAINAAWDGVARDPAVGSPLE